jgi:hypothetical protein
MVNDESQTRGASIMTGWCGANRTTLIPVAVMASLPIWFCSAEEGASGRRPLKCVVPTPRVWSNEGLVESFKTSAQLSRTICLPDPVDWFEAEGKPPEQAKAHREFQWQQSLLRRHDLNVFIQIDPYKTRRGPIPDLPRSIRSRSFSDPVLRKAFIADVMLRQRLYDPTYVCLGMEINAYFDENPRDFDHFVSLFKEARRAIKQVRPDAVVLVSFQYEQFLGILGGQGHLPKHPPQWELLQRFEPEADAIGISSYPMSSFSPLRFGDPNDLPAHYYNQLSEHTSKPIVFAELGWPSDSRFGGSPARQAAFLRRFPVLTSKLDVRLVNWFLLYDAKGFGEVFESMGLIDSSGRSKPAYDLWKDLWPEPRPIERK